MSHRIAMSFTRDAILFKSRVHGPNYEVGAQICDLSVLQLHARRSSSSSVGSAMCIASPRGARLQLTRRRKGTKRPTHCRKETIVSGLFLTSFLFNGPRNRSEPAARQACVWHQVGVATTRPDSPCHYARRHATSRAVGGGGAGKPTQGHMARLKRGLYTLRRYKLTDAIIPTHMHRIPSELRS
ncbi:unnamed protein product [Prunus armeniaca]